MNKTYSIISYIIGVLLLTLSILCHYKFFPLILKTEIHKNIDLKENTMAFEMWKKQPFPMKFRVYFFNVTNPEEVQYGGKPILKEIGPYVYDEYREKIDININEDHDSLEYMLKRNFQFNSTESFSLKADDFVTIINPAFVGTVLQISTIAPNLLTMINQAAPFIFNNMKDIFLRTKVKDFLFEGVTLYCTEPSIEFICSGLKTALPIMMKIAENDKDFIFSVFGHLNVTEDYSWEIGRGLKNTKKGEILEFDGDDSVDNWNDDFCNKINGSDGTLFPPLDTERPKKFYLFSSEFCRSFYVNYEKDHNIYGVLTARYVMIEEVFAQNKQNECFCPKAINENEEVYLNCPKNGLTYVTPCIKAPVLLSNPHFYLGSKNLLEFVQGLKPLKEKHQSYLEIEPITGTPFSGYKRIQVNIEVKKVESIDMLENVSEGVFPILWIEEGVDLPKDLQNFIKSNLKRRFLLVYLTWFLVIAGFLLMVVPFIIIMKKEKTLCFEKNQVIEINIPTAEIPANIENLYNNAERNKFSRVYYYK